jgi:hypothetical protein
VEKKEAEPPEVSKPAKIKSERPTDPPDPVVTTHVIVPEQNRKTTKNNQAAQIQEPHSKVGASLTDDDNAFTERAFPVKPDPIGPISDDTKVPNMHETAAGAVNELYANATQARMPSHEASTMARPESDPPDVASSRRRFVEPTDKLPMTATA